MFGMRHLNLLLLIIFSILSPPYLRNLGSKASRNPSPITLKAKIVKQINNAGKNKRHGKYLNAGKPSDAIVPQLAIGAC